MSTTEELDGLLIKSLVLLEWRLKRLEYLLGSGVQKEGSEAANKSVMVRIDKLDKKWQKLVKQEKAAEAMSALCAYHNDVVHISVSSN